MSQTIVTAGEFMSMPGRFYYTLMVNNRRVSCGKDCGSGGPEAAAAKAVELAINYGGEYLILGPAKVMRHIPESIRSGMISA